MSCRRKGGAGQSGSFALGKGAGGCELQRKARRPAGARARKIQKEKNRRKTPAALENMGLEPTAY